MVKPMVTSENSFVGPAGGRGRRIDRGFPRRRNALDLLRDLGYDDGDADATAGRARMLRAAALFRRLFRLPVPDAPGLMFFGAEADPASLGPHNKGLPVGRICRFRA